VQSISLPLRRPFLFFIQPLHPPVTVFFRLVFHHRVLALIALRCRTDSVYFFFNATQSTRVRGGRGPEPLSSGDFFFFFWRSLSLAGFTSALLPSQVGIPPRSTLRALFFVAFQFFFRVGRKILLLVFFLPLRKPGTSDPLLSLVCLEIDRPVSPHPAISASLMSHPTPPWFGCFSCFLAAPPADPSPCTHFASASPLSFLERSGLLPPSLLSGHPHSAGSFCFFLDPRRFPR